MERQGCHGDIERRGGQLGDGGRAGSVVISEEFHLYGVVALRQIAEGIAALGVRRCRELASVDKQQGTLERLSGSIFHHAGDISLVVFGYLDVGDCHSVVGSHVAAVVEAYVICRIFIHHGQVGTQRVHLSLLRREEVELGDAVLTGIVCGLGKRDVERLGHLDVGRYGVERQLVVLARLKLDVGRDEHVAGREVIVSVRDVCSRRVSGIVSCGEAPLAVVSVEVVHSPEAELVVAFKADCGRYLYCRAEHGLSCLHGITGVASGLRRDSIAV